LSAISSVASVYDRRPRVWAVSPLTERRYSARCYVVAGFVRSYCNRPRTGG
jgi:hypothetical protein